MGALICLHSIVFFSASVFAIQCNCYAIHKKNICIVYLYKQSTLVFLGHTGDVQERCSGPWPCCPHSWWDEIIITGLLMDLQDSGVEYIYDCVWVQLCVSPVTPCVQACSQGQAWWVMNKQWQQQGRLGEIQALRPHWGFGGKEKAVVWRWSQ